MMQDSEYVDFSYSDYEEVDIENSGSDSSVCNLIETVYSVCSRKRDSRGIDTEYTIDDIKPELENFNYTTFDIQRFTKKTESGFKPIKTVKVTQIGCSIPERVPIGFEMIKTTLYYEKPRQCTNCWKFGHIFVH
ncbi:hypothetical protein TNCV_3190291 [Trichonephila clavipes]|nr:hypothetical protein TNCV_3190291 [Trichonephila clavipes]